jgi:hypothetical protein
MNREFPAYRITRDGFAILAMGFTGKEAMKWKEKYIKAFNAMEKALLKQSESLEWKQARIQSKGVRKSITDVIARFVEYATAQGSESATRYYSNITKMEYAALELVEKGSKIPDNFRDTLDTMDLCFLITAEQICKLALNHGMEEKLHYKDIYQVAKERVMDYAKVVRVTHVRSNQKQLKDNPCDHSDDC